MNAQPAKRIIIYATCAFGKMKMIMIGSSNQFMNKLKSKLFALVVAINAPFLIGDARSVKIGIGVGNAHP